MPMERVRTWWFLCDQCRLGEEIDPKHVKCAKHGKVRKYSTCGALAPTKICDEFEWGDE